MVFIELNRDQHRIELTSQYHERDLVKKIPGSKWDSNSKQWTLPVSWGSCITARGVFGDKLRVGPELSKWSWEKRQAVDNAFAIRDLDQPDDTPLPWVDDPDLYNFQRVGATFLAESPHALLADDMGTGKTIQVLSALRHIAKNEDTVFPALIVCPNSIKSQWAQETLKWFPEANPYVVTGSAKQRRDVLAKAQADPQALVIMNIESIRQFSRLAPYGSIRLNKCVECGGTAERTSACEVHSRELNTFGFQTCVLDEAHRVKEPKAKQTRAIWAVFNCLSVQWRWALTGTPIANHVGDLWSVMHAIAPLDFPVKTPFLDRYAVKEWNEYGGLEIAGLQRNTRDEFFKIFDPMFRRMTKQRVLPQLPLKTRVVRTVGMSPQQKKAYKEIEDRLVTFLEDGTPLVARSSLAGGTRLLQFTSSYVEIDKGETPDDPDTWTVRPKEPSPKIDELVEIIQELDGSSAIAVVAEHRKLLDLACKRLDKENIRYTTITGEVPDHLRGNRVNQFQNGEVDVILFTHKAGGVGLNLTRASTMVRLQRSWSLIDNKQSEDRVYRIGSEVHNSVTIIDVITEDTIENAQVQRLNTKLGRLDEITRDRAHRINNSQHTDDLDQEEASIMNSYLGEL